jgi:hypothetical protein
MTTSLIARLFLVGGSVINPTPRYLVHIMAGFKVHIFGFIYSWISHFVFFFFLLSRDLSFPQGFRGCSHFSQFTRTRLPFVSSPADPANKGEHLVPE